MRVFMKTVGARAPYGNKVLVAGGAGYVGCLLVPRLIDAGYSVVVLDRFFFGETLTTSTAAPRDSPQIVRSDIRNFDPSILNGVYAVVDLCGISNDPSCDLDSRVTWSINVEGATRLIDLSVAAGVRRYVYASSCSVYGHGEGLQLTEGMPCFPKSLYAQSKVRIEQLLLERGREAHGNFQPVVLRLATLFGVSPRMRFDLALNTMANCAYVEKRINVDGDGGQWRPFVHVNDAATAVMLALDAQSARASNKIFNIGSNKNNRQIRQLAHDVQAFIPAAKILYSNSTSDARNYNVDFARAEAELKFSPSTSIDEGIREVIDAIVAGKVSASDDRTLTVKHYRTMFSQSLIDASTPVMCAREASLS